jgi:hypothetical protein
VLVVIALGVVVVLVAMFDFSTLTDFSGVCAPWLFVMFTSGAMVMLPFAGTVGIGADDAYGLGGIFCRLGITPSGRGWSLSSWRIGCKSSC